MENKVNFRKLEQPGSYPSLETKLALQLATAIHNSESDGVAISWSAQERAQDFVNSHDITECLDELFRLEDLALKRQS